MGEDVSFCRLARGSGFTVVREYRVHEPRITDPMGHGSGKFGESLNG